MKERRKRLNLGIKRELQRRLILKILIIVVISLLCSTLLFYLYSSREVGKTYHQAHIRIRSFLELLWPVIIGGLIIGLGLGLLMALFYPHPIAGPLFRIERELRKVGGGDLTLQLRLRKGDELKDLAEAINGMVGELRQRVERLKEQAAGVQKAAEGGKEGEVRERIRGLLKELEDFKT